MELSTRLREAPAGHRPALFGDETLAFPSEVGELVDTYGHYLPTQTTGYADALSGDPRRPYTAPAKNGRVTPGRAAPNTRRTLPFPREG